MKSLYTGMLASGLLITSLCYAQTEGDAIRFSSSTFGTTARSMSMGGAFGALGADFSCLSNNPAGIAAYRKSEITISPTFIIRNIDSRYINNTTPDSRFFFNIGSAGMVASGYKASREGWKGWSFGIGYNREDSYKKNVTWQGFNTENSLYDAMAEEVQGVKYSDFEELGYAFDAGLAWNVYLLNQAPTGPTDYESAIPNGGVLQIKTEDITGRKGSFVMSVGNNYKEKLQLGMSLEFASFSYWEDNRYEEVDIYDTIISPYQQMDFKSSLYTQYKYTHGNGFIMKFGAIAKPNDMIRIGAAIHTPGWYHVNYQDEYNMLAQFGNSSDSLFTQEPVASVFAYDLTTPFKFIGSLALVFEHNFLISADYEYVDYNSTKMSAPDYNFSQENSNIRTICNGASNVRVGGEYKYDLFAFRAGAAFYGSPYKKQFTDGDYNYSSMSYTAGIGIRDKSYFFDIGYAFTKNKVAYQPYTMATEAVPSVYQDIKTNRIMLTFGVRF